MIDFRNIAAFCVGTAMMLGASEGQAAGGVSNPVVDCTANPAALAGTNFYPGTTYQLKGSCKGDFYIEVNNVTLQPLAPATRATVTGPIAVFAPGTTLKNIDIAGPFTVPSPKGIIAGLWVNGGTGIVIYEGGTISGVTGLAGALASDSGLLLLYDATVSGNTGDGVEASEGGHVILGNLGPNGPILQSTVTGNSRFGVEAWENGTITGYGATIRDSLVGGVASNGGSLTLWGGTITAPTGLTALQASGGSLELRPPPTGGGPGPAISAPGGIGVFVDTAGHAIMRAASITADGASYALFANTGASVTSLGGNRITNTNASGRTVFLIGNSAFLSVDGTTNGYSAASDTITGSTGANAVPFQVFGNSSAFLQATTVVGNVLVDNLSSLTLANEFPSDSVLLENNLILSEAAGATGVPGAAHSKIHGNVNCSDSTSHFNAAYITVNGSINCGSFQ